MWKGETVLLLISWPHCDRMHFLRYLIRYKYCIGYAPLQGHRNWKMFRSRKRHGENSASILIGLPLSLAFSTCSPLWHPSRSGAAFLLPLTRSRYPFPPCEASYQQVLIHNRGSRPILMTVISKSGLHHRRSMANETNQRSVQRSGILAPPWHISALWQVL